VHSFTEAQSYQFRRYVSGSNWERLNTYMLRGGWFDEGSPSPSSQPLPDPSILPRNMSELAIPRLPAFDPANPWDTSQIEHQPVLNEDHSMASPASPASNALLQDQTIASSPIPPDLHISEEDYRSLKKLDDMLAEREQSVDSQSLYAELRAINTTLARHTEVIAHQNKVMMSYQNTVVHQGKVMATQVTAGVGDMLLLNRGAGPTSPEREEGLSDPDSNAAASRTYQHKPPKTRSKTHVELRRRQQNAPAPDEGDEPDEEEEDGEFDDVFEKKVKKNRTKGNAWFNVSTFVHAASSPPNLMHGALENYAVRTSCPRIRSKRNQE
jgi:hypothetical protein